MFTEKKRVIEGLTVKNSSGGERRMVGTTAREINTGGDGEIERFVSCDLGLGRRVTIFACLLAALVH
jgi:hypothetical protein